MATWFSMLELKQATEAHLAMPDSMASKSLMAWLLVMAEDIDDQELLFVVINKTLLFQKVVKCFDD